MLLLAQTAGEKFSIGGVTTFLGLGMTFIVLGLLIGCIFLLEIFIKKLTKFLAERKDTTAKVIVEAVEEPIEVTASPVEATIIDEGVRQAIIEAVAMFSQVDDKDKKPHRNITIRSILEIE